MLRATALPMRFFVDAGGKPLVLEARTVIRYWNLRIATVILAFTVAGAGQAGAQRWTPIGPGGGLVWAVAIDPVTPSRAYAAAGSTVLWTADAGLTWHEPSSGMASDGVVLDVTVNALAPSRVWAIKQAAQAVLRSTDGGVNWTNASLVGQFYSIAFDPTDAQVAYVGGSGTVFRSGDGGDSWTNLHVSGGLSVEAIIVAPSNPAHLYVGQFFGGVRESLNGGATWTDASSGLADLRIFGMSMDPSNEAILYAATVGGIFKSADGAASWHTTGILPCQPAGEVAVHPLDGSILYVPTECGVYRSGNGGISWAPYHSGIPAMYATAVAIDRLAPSRLLAAMDAVGVWRTSDGGASWVPSSDGINFGYVGSLAVDPLTPGTVYAGLGKQGIFRSTTSGDVWSRGAGTHEADHYDMPSIAVDPNAPAVLYAADGDVVSKSVDGGITWSATGPLVPTSSVWAVAVDPFTSAVYAGTGTGMLFRSTDGGASWSPTGFGSGATIWSIAIDPTTPGHLVWTYGDGVVVSTDGAATWTFLPGVGSGTTRGLAIDPTDGTRVYAALENDGLFGSTDGGITWTRLGGSVLPSQLVAVTIDPTNPLRVFVGGYSGGGVFGSGDRGASWSRLTDGLPSSRVDALAVSAGSPPTLFAGTDDRSAFRLSLALCVADVDCEDGDLCTVDTCAPGGSGTNLLGCRHAPVACSTPGECQLAGSCNPTSGACEYPVVPDGSSCADDGTICTADRCAAGACVHPPNVASFCDVASPSGASRVTLRGTAGRKRFGWKWAGPVITLGEVGNPFTSGASDYALCMFDHAGPAGTLRLVLAADAPAGGTCAGQPCWNASSATVRYRDRAAAPDGLTRVRIVTGGTRRPGVLVDGKGSNLQLGSLPVVPPLLLQLRRDDTAGVCWSANFATGIRANDEARFSAVSD